MELSEYHKLLAKAERALVKMQTSAKERGIECSMTTSDILAAWHLWPTCVYSGQEFTPTNYKTWERVDNDVGYHPGNVILVGHQLNACKSDHSLERLEEMLEQVLKGWGQHFGNTLQSINQRMETVRNEHAHTSLTLETHHKWISNTMHHIVNTRRDLDELEKSARGLISKLEKQRRLEQIIDALQSGRAKAEAEKLLPPPRVHIPWWKRALGYLKSLDDRYGPFTTGQSQC